MYSINRSYLKKIKEKTSGYRANWLPNSPIALGDIGILENGVFTRMTNLSEQGVEIQERISNDKNEYTITSGSDVKIYTKVTGETSEQIKFLAKADAGFEVELANGNAFVFHAQKATVRQIESKEATEQLFIEKAKQQSKWKKYVVITEVVDVEHFTFLNSHEGNNRIALKAGGKIGTGAVNLADVGLDLKIHRQSNASDSFIGESITPLYRAMGLSSSFFGSGSLKTKGIDNDLKPVADDKLIEVPFKKLHGLFVGVNDYSKFNKNANLKGSVNDGKKIHSFFERSYPHLGFDDFSSVSLFNEDANKGSVVSSIASFKSALAPNDTFIFFFSGHGTFELADAEQWGSEQIECLACYGPQDKFLLADKEVRYLLSELKTDAHVVTIFDCCHARGMTRALVAEDNIKNINQSFPKRPWENFVFFDNIAEENLMGNNVDELLPTAPHVHISAAETHQYAYEKDGEGVLTKVLLSILENQDNNITYNTLQSRLVNYTRTAYKQTPSIGSFGIDNLLKVNILNNNLPLYTTYAEIVFRKQGDKDDGNWVLNHGALHGLSEGDAIRVIGTDTQLHIANIHLDWSEVDTGNLELDTGKAYAIEVDKTMYAQTLHIELDNINLSTEVFQEIVGSLYAISSDIAVFCPKETDGAFDYTLHFRDSRTYLTHPNNPYRLLFESIPVSTGHLTKFGEILGSKLLQVSKWGFVNNLNNQEANNLDAESAINVLVEHNKSSSLEDNGFLEFEAPVGSANFFKIKITNTSDAGMYVLPIFLHTRFGISSDIIADKPTFIDAGKSANLSIDYAGDGNRDQKIYFNLEDYTLFYNWEYEEVKLKVIYSSSSFSLPNISQSDFDKPEIKISRSKNLTEVSTSKDFGKKPVLERKDVWSAFNASIRMMNPHYNQVNSDVLSEGMSNEWLSYFIVGLYFDLDNESPFEPNLKLKKGIKVPEEQKGLLDDAKLFLANNVEVVRRNKRFKKTKEQGFPVLLAEGDSWFLYPFFVKEIIDHLSNSYAIKSLAAAGDTLENMVKKRKYLKSIEEEKPLAFLVSGGGNDILGKQFKDFIKDDIIENEYREAEAYLNSMFPQKIDFLEKLYRDIFESVSIPTIVHGYDYVIPVDTTVSTEKSWLGIYMIEKHINDQQNRQRVLDYMIDCFNTMLEKASNDFEHVHFVNVRNTVNNTEWFDEIHPDDVGFEKVASLINQQLLKLFIQ